MTPTRRWQFAWSRTWADALEGAHGAAWRALAASSPQANAFHAPAVVRIWADTVGAAIGAEPVVGRATASDGTEAVLPWVVVPHAGRRITRRVLEPVGQALFGYHDPLLSRAVEPELAAALWDEARVAAPGGAQTALFRLVHADAAPGPMSEPVREESPVLELAGTAELDALLATLSRNAREQVRRQRRKLEAVGPVAFECAPPERAAAAAAEFRSAVVPAYHALWRDRAAGSLLDAPGVTEFYARVIAEGVTAGWAQFARLTVAGQPVAWHVGLVHRTGWYWWLPAYAAKHADHSPGRVLLAELIARAIHDHVPRLHFLIGGQRYKLSWRPRALDLRTVRWYAPGARGAALKLYDRVLAPSATDAPTEDPDA